VARYKHIDTSPRFLAVDLQRQLLPGSVEHALNHLIDHELVLSSFDARYQNDQTGAAAYPPAMLLKVVLFAYSQGIVSSRGIERDCRDHVTFITLSEDTMPHFTTIAGFVPPRSFGFGFLQTPPHPSGSDTVLNCKPPRNEICIKRFS
jgi:hypothetical protein